MKTHALTALAVAGLSVASLLVGQRATAQTATPLPTGKIEWGIAEKLAAGSDGVTSSSQVAAIGATTLELTSPLCSPTPVVQWQISNGQSVTGGCRVTVQLPEGSYTVSARIAARKIRFERDIVVQNFVIAVVGDSNASGEGNSVAGRWANADCHRSANAGAARAARAIETSDFHSVVTLIHLACSGAGAETGLLGDYAGMQEDNVTQPAQFAALSSILGGNELDAIVMSVGVNDMGKKGFGDLIARCLLGPVEGGPLDCSDTTDSSSSAFEFAATLQQMLGRYRSVTNCLSSAPLCPGRPSIKVDPTRVYQTEYPDLASDELGVLCSIPPGMSQDEFLWTRTAGRTLNNSLARVASGAGYRFVSGISNAFVNHGYCASDGQRWIVTVTESFATQGNKDGSFHPNALGHAAQASVIAKAVKVDLYPNGLPRPPANPSAQRPASVQTRVIEETVTTTAPTLAPAPSLAPTNPPVTRAPVTSPPAPTPGPTLAPTVPATSPPTTPTASPSRGATIPSGAPAVGAFVGSSNSPLVLATLFGCALDGVGTLRIVTSAECGPRESTVRWHVPVGATGATAPPRDRSVLKACVAPNQTVRVLTGGNAATGSCAANETLQGWALRGPGVGQPHDPTRVAVCATASAVRISPLPDLPPCAPNESRIEFFRDGPPPAGSPLDASAPDQTAIDRDRAATLVKAFDQNVVPQLARTVSSFALAAEILQSVTAWQAEVQRSGVAVNATPELADRVAKAKAAFAQVYHRLFVTRIVPVDVTPKYTSYKQYVDRSAEIETWLAAVAKLELVDDPVMSEDIAFLKTAQTELHTRAFTEAVLPRATAASTFDSISLAFIDLRSWQINGETLGVVTVSFDQNPQAQAAAKPLVAALIADFDRRFPASLRSDPTKVAAAAADILAWYELAAAVDQLDPSHKLKSRMDIVEGLRAPKPPAVTAPSKKVVACSGVSALAPTGGLGRFGIRMQTAGACGFLVDGDIVSSYATAAAVIDRWTVQLTAFRDQVRAAGAVGAVLEPFVDETIAAGTAMASKFAGTGSAPMDPADEQALIDWYDAAVRSLNSLADTERLVLLRQSIDTASALKDKQRKIAADSLAAMRERQRRAFCVSVSLCAAQAEDEGLTLASAIEGVKEARSSINDAADAFNDYQEFARNHMPSLVIPDITTRFDFARRLKTALGPLSAFNAHLGKVFDIHDKIRKAADLAKLFSPSATGMGDLSKALSVYPTLIEKATAPLTAVQGAMVPGLAAVGPIAEQISTLALSNRERWVNGLNRKNFEAGDWGAVMAWEFEPGGQAVAIYMRDVMRATVANLPAAPTGEVAKFFVNFEDELNEGTATTGSWTTGTFTTTIDPAAFRSWVYGHRADVWALLYGSRIVPTTIRLR